MASRSLGTLTLDLIAKIGGFEQGMDRAARTADRKGREISAAARKRAKETEEAWAGVGTAIGAVFSSIAVGAVFQKFIAETKQAEKEQAQLAAVLKSTGNAAGYSQERLNQMADAMQQSLGVAAGDVNSAQTVLLAFTNIVGEKLPAALQAAADHAARTGSTIQASAEIMGRALDVPSVGMATLQKQGFKFSESQIEVARELERTGKIAEAQQMVLDSLNESYGGAAAAARDAFGGALGALQNTINDLLTGDSGSMAQMKKSVEGLNATLSSEETRAAFQTLISFMAGLATQAARTAAVLNSGGIWGWLSVSNKEADDIKGTVDTVTGQIDRLKKQRDELDPAKSVTNKLNDFLFGDVGDLDRQISVLEGKLKGAKARLALDQTTTPDLAPILAPDLTPRTPGIVNLKDGDKKGGRATGKSQAEKDAEAAEKFIQQLQAQAFKIQEKTAYEQLFFDLQLKGLNLSESQVDKAIGLVTAIDMAKESEKTKAAQIERQNALYEVQDVLLGKQNQYALELAGYGLGAKAVAEMRERIGLLDQYQQKMDKMRQDQANAIAGAGSDSDVERINAQYAERLELTQEALAQELAMYDDFIAQKRLKEEDWQAGAMAGLQSYMESSRDVYGQTQQIVMDAFGAMENTLVEFVKTGKLDMQGLFSGIAEDVLRMLIKMGTQMVVHKLLGDTLQAAGVATAVAAGSATAAAWAPAAAMASLASFGANAAPASLGIASTVALSQGMALAGFADGGYTGAGGKFDVAGMVHKGEGVLSQRDIGAMGGPSAFEAFRASLHTGYADGGYVSAAQPGYADGPAQAAPAIVNIIEDSSKAGQVEEKRDDMDRHIINVFVRNIRGGGEAAEAIQGTWGLDRKGR